MKALHRLAWVGAVALLLALAGCKGSKVPVGTPAVDVDLDTPEAIRAPKSPVASGPFGAWMLESRDLAQGWLQDSGAPTATARTPAYADLLFAFGLARLGEADAARNLMAGARQALAGQDQAHTWLSHAFEHRIQQSLDGKPHTGPLPAGQLRSLAGVDRLQRYVADRLRKHSRVLEPDQRINPYRHWSGRISAFEKDLAELTDLTDSGEIAKRVDRLLREVPEGPGGSEQRARVLKAALEAAPRVGKAFARKMLDQTIPAYDALPEAKDVTAVVERAAFLEKALFVAGHFGQVASARALMERFRQMLPARQGAQVFQALDPLADQAFQTLRKLDLRDEMEQTLAQLAALVLKGREVKQIDFKKADQGPATLRLLLRVAAGWYCLGRDGQAEPIREAAWGVLHSGNLNPRDQTQLACAYVQTLGQAPAEAARKRLKEVFRRLRGVKDTYTTSTHFSVSQLELVESGVLAILECASSPPRK
jgi:hypothetical protein